MSHMIVRVKTEILEPRIGHCVLLRSECIVLLRSFKELNVLLRSFFEFLATYETFFLMRHSFAFFS